VGVSRDSVESHKKFKSQFGFPFMLLSDEDSKLRDAFGVSKRSTFVIDAEGTILSVWPKVDVDGHAAEVLASLP
jgi:peroxiredoxin Q/BCP